MSDKKKKVFVKPELVKFDKPLDEVTLCQTGTPCDLMHTPVQKAAMAKDSRNGIVQVLIEDFKQTL